MPSDNEHSYPNLPPPRRPSPSNHDDYETARVLQFLSDAVKEQSNKIGMLSDNIDDISTAITSIETSFKLHLNDHGHCDESRVKHDVDIEAKLNTLQQKIIDGHEKDLKERIVAYEKEQHYRKQRRNYWIGIPVTLVAGIIGTLAVTWLTNACTVIDPRAKPTTTIVAPLTAAVNNAVVNKK